MVRTICACQKCSEFTGHHQRTPCFHQRGHHGNAPRQRILGCQLQHAHHSALLTGGQMSPLMFVDPTIPAHTMPVHASACTSKGIMALCAKIYCMLIPCQKGRPFGCICCQLQRAHQSILHTGGLGLISKDPDCLHQSVPSPVCRAVVLMMSIRQRCMLSGMEAS